MYRHQHIQAVASLTALTLMFSPSVVAQNPTGPAPHSTSLDRPANTVPDASRQVAENSMEAPARPSHLEELGDLYVVRKRYVDAVTAYQEAAGSSPVLWNKLGIAYQHLFNIKAARASYEHSLRLNPKYPEALNNLGTVLYAEKDYRRAAKYYNAALKLSPHSAVIYANLGTAQFAKGDYKRGVKSYREAFSIDPGVFQNGSGNKIEEVGSREARAMLNFHLAKFYAKAKMNAEAIACLREALDNGFHDRKKLMEDEELAELRETQEFRQLLTMQGLTNPRPMKP